MRLAAAALALLLPGCIFFIDDDDDGDGANPICGNAVVERYEQCDDGNNNAADGCYACRLERDAMVMAP